MKVQLIENENNNIVGTISVNNISEAINIINQIETYTINDREYRKEKTDICYKRILQYG